MKQPVLKKIICGAMAGAMMLVSFAGCSADSGSSSKGLDDKLAYAAAKAMDYSHYQKRSATMFSESIFAKANAAAMMMNDQTADEDYEKIASYLYLDSITVADDDRKVVASYPDDNKGKSLKELPDVKLFTKVAQNIAFKLMTDPVLDEETGQYSLYAGVKRADGSGVVVIGLKTDAYADVTGANLAEKCGNNTLIVKDGTVISSTLEGVDAQATTESAGISEDDLKKDSFSLTVGDRTYTCKAKTVDEFSLVGPVVTVICAE